MCCKEEIELERNCINCGAQLPADASFCPCCMSSQIEKHDRPAKGRGNEIFLGVIAFLLTLLLAAPFAVRFVSDKTAPKDEPGISVTAPEAPSDPVPTEEVPAGAR